MDFDETTLLESDYSLSKVFDFDYPARLKKKFIILSLPRTGSAKLANTLFDSGLAGAPFEYFHKNLLKHRNNPEKRPNELNAYLDEMIARRTSPNGYFGMKMHFGQFEYLFGGNPHAMAIGIQLLSEFDKRILIYRRDKISQSISQLLGRETNSWSKPENYVPGGLGRAFTSNDIVEISNILHTFLYWEHSWRKLLPNVAGDFIEVAYEDLCEFPNREFERIFKYLEIDQPQDGSSPFKAPKQTIADVTAEMRRDFLEAIGVVPDGSTTGVMRGQG